MALDVSDTGDLVVAYRNTHVDGQNHEHIDYVNEYARVTDVTASWPDERDIVAVAGVQLSPPFSVRASFAGSRVVEGSLCSEGLVYATDSTLPPGLVLTIDGFVEGTATDTNSKPVTITVLAQIRDGSISTGLRLSTVAQTDFHVRVV